MDTNTGMTIIASNVVYETTAAESSASRLNFVASIVVIAALDEEIKHGDMDVLAAIRKNKRSFRAYFCLYVIPSGHPAVLSDPELQHGAAEAVSYFETPDVSALYGGKVLKH